jgi:hypothetical protein
LGQVIGVVASGETVAAIPAGGRWFPVLVMRDAFDPAWETGGHSLEYPTFDCTGQAYANDTASPFPIWFISSTNVLYGESGPEQKVEVNSHTDVLNGSECDQFTYEEPKAVPMAVVLNLNVFVPPFKVIALPPRRSTSSRRFWVCWRQKFQSETLPSLDLHNRRIRQTIGETSSARSGSAPDPDLQRPHCRVGCPSSKK